MHLLHWALLLTFCGIALGSPNTDAICAFSKAIPGLQNLSPPWTCNTTDPCLFLAPPPQGIACPLLSVIIILANLSLSGSIPTEVGLLPSLFLLELQGNQLGGTIPTQMGSLSKLVTVWLQDNRLGGTIPTQIGLLTSSVWLDLGDNQLNGAIPTTVGMLQSMRILSLGGNQLGGTIPTEIGLMTSLNVTNLGDNRLSGTIPTQMGKLTSMVLMDLSSNKLSGSIPTQLGSLTNLNLLALKNNNFSGCLPTNGVFSLLLECFLLADYNCGCTIFEILGCNPVLPFCPTIIGSPGNNQVLQWANVTGYFADNLRLAQQGILEIYETFVIIAGNALFNGDLVIHLKDASQTRSIEATTQDAPIIVSGTATLSGPLDIYLPPSFQQGSNYTVQVMTFNSSQGSFTKITPYVNGEASPCTQVTPQSKPGSLSLSFNLPQSCPNAAGKLQTTARTTALYSCLVLFVAWLLC